MKMKACIASIASMLLMFGTSAAYAQNCTAGTPAGNVALSPSQLRTLLSQRMACVGSSPNFAAQEWVGNIGTNVTSPQSLQDFKRGGNANDPTKVVGTVAVTGSTTGLLTYSYTLGGTYTYNVFGTSTSGVGNYSWCGAGANPGTNTLVAIKAGGAAPVTC